ncbi:3D domain-containing protein [Paenibacillus polysaccharolyticus]|uniref:3D domain-containing protein n=1 Tax=Paenibacillus polysaccharolyticus TaxID=582692 RepID=UPI00300A6D04
MAAINGVPPNKPEPTQPAAVSSQVSGKSAKDDVWQTYEATAYTAFCAEGCTGITASGLDVSETTMYKGRTVIATDPKFIALGTRITIRTADGEEIAGISADKGGAIKGRKLDVLVASEKEARKFGRQKVRVKIEN